MFNVQAVVLKQLLTTDDAVQVTFALARLRKEHFTDAFSSIYVAIQNYYKTSGKIPTLDSLRLSANRNVRLSQALAVLDMQEVPEVEISESIDVLETEFAQDLTLKLLESEVLNDLYALDKDALVDRLNSLAMQVENEVGQSGAITQAYEIEIFKEKGAPKLAVSLGISNEFEIHSGSLQRTEVMFLGGFRGSGKSIVCCNMQVTQYQQGKVSPYFSLEMKAHEVMERNLAILSGVSASSLRLGRLAPEEVQQLLKTRASMFHGGLDEYHKYAAKYTINEMSDGFELEKLLRTEFEEITPMPIIHDPKLSIEQLGAITRGLISVHGEESVELVILDYLNQVRVHGTSDIQMYDWIPQMVVAKQFKTTCGELNVAGVSPYQMDKHGNARMSQGILDSCDMALTLNPAKKPKGADGKRDPMGAIVFETTKVRSMDDMILAPGISWETLRIDPAVNYTKEDLLVKGLELALDFDKKSGDKSERKGKKTPPKKDLDPNTAGGPPAGATDL
ncbi:DNA helicase [Providencia phage vB_PreS_PR1]|uniref:DNA helicase n=1 Tax=Providencia phage vB_PreS_PR1 TaxID=1931407 RepID=A0A1S6KUW8_9CAUD|nr:DNA helicase [Providencia phage vB_PreS_PR1]AQT25215.1 DNA helicase [Providencia phage vB_PreS_PR1]